MKKLSITAVLLFIISGCNQQTLIDQNAEGEKLMELSRQWAKSESNEEYLGYWAEDALFKAPNEPVLRGTSEISKMLERDSQLPGFEIDWEPQEAFVSKSGDLGYLIENLRVSMNDSLGNKMHFYNKVVTIWKKHEDGTWKNVVDFASADPSIKSLK
ncbi:MULTISPECIES: YybH family protein [Arenibacter]|uniref:YybH family protein n=1 Tax=Arenibacter TaxID=178469 RepID=UPI0012FFFE16|nr:MULTISPECIES: nuclear transport factor 2 family protein [Arenibacter]